MRNTDSKFNNQGEYSRPLSNMFGQEFNHLNIAEGTPYEKTVADAVVLIDMPDGRGTGTFISEDGLVLTNGHVVPRGRCVRNQRCKDIRLIRGWYPGGPKEVFKDIQVIAHTKDGADVSLLKVNTGGRKVPFVPLATKAEVEKSLADAKGSLEVTVVGHPYGGLAKVARSSIISSSASGYFTLKTTAISGCSGSLIIDPVLRKAIGLFHAVNVRIDAITYKRGETIYTGEGQNLTRVYESLGWDGRAHGVTNIKTLPLTKEEVLSGNKDLFESDGAYQTMAPQIYAFVAETPFERFRVLSSFIENLRYKNFPSEDMINFLYGVLTSYDNSHEKPASDVAIAVGGLYAMGLPIEKARELEGSSVVHSIRAMVNPTEYQKGCLKFWTEEAGPASLQMFCFFIKDKDGYDNLKNIMNWAQEYAVSNRRLNENAFGELLDYAEFCLRHLPLTENYRRVFVALIKKELAGKIITKQLYKAESIILALSEAPETFKGWELKESK